MKNIYILLISSILLISCNQERKHLEYAQKKADTFVKCYAKDFLFDNELMKYNYNPRMQFFNEQDSTNKYLIFLRENEIIVNCITDSCTLTEPFFKTPLILLRGEYVLKQDSLFTGNIHDLSTVKLLNFNEYPEKYYFKLKKRLEKFGIFAYYKDNANSYIIIFVTNQYYLIHTNKIQQMVKNDEIIKCYDDCWYLIKMEKPMDLG